MGRAEALQKGQLSRTPKSKVKSFCWRSRFNRYRRNPEGRVKSINQSITFEDICEKLGTFVVLTFPLHSILFLARMEAGRKQNGFFLFLVAILVAGGLAVHSRNIVCWRTAVLEALVLREAPILPIHGLISPATIGKYFLRGPNLADQRAAQLAGQHFQAS